MNAVHSNLLTKPTCGVDKWLDNHHAFDTQTSGTGSQVVSYIEKHAPFYYCMPGGGPGPPPSDDATALQRRLQGPPPSGYVLHYIIDPTGWGIQLDMNFETQPSGCSNSLLGEEDGSSYNPACDLGTC